ncbi:MAG: hypothetical protein AAF602_08965, partial [Myxococcota bacterium]
MNLKSFCVTALVATFALGCGTGTECDTYYRDRDKDGFGDPDNSRFTCSQPRNFVTNDRDCDDRDDTATPTGTYEGDLAIDADNEGDLQAFVAACPGTVAGNITIINTDRDDIDFLHSVSTVEGTLTISNNAELSDLRPLQNLTDVGGLTLSLNKGVRDLDELDNLERAASLRLSLLLTDEENDLSVFSDVEGIQDLAINVTGVNDYAGLPELTTLSGDLLLGGPSINSLAGIETITSVGGSLTITNFRNDVDMSTLAVTEVGNFLRISDNEGLATVVLPNLTTAGNIDVRNNGPLATLDIPAVTATGDIVFNSNGSLATFNSAIEDATDLDLTNLPELTTLSGFAGLDQVELEGLIVRNTGVTSLEGLEGVETVTGSMQVVGNVDLPAMTGLDGLASVSGLIQIVNNDRLASLTGLESLADATAGIE